MKPAQIESGFADADRPAVAACFWGAFGAKLGRVMAPAPRALAFVAEMAAPSHAIVARDDAGRVIGLAGYKTAEGAFLGGTLSDLARHYGWTGALWRGPLLEILEREVDGDTLLMDGICVTPEARGRGLGTALLRGICDVARARRLAHVRLSVIDTNPRAKALYLREGFLSGEPKRLGPLRHLFGFSHATEMKRPVS